MKLSLTSVRHLMRWRTCDAARDCVLHFAVTAAVTEINNQSDGQPHEEPHPVGPAQAVDHGAAHDYPQDRHHWQQGHLESALQVWSSVAQNPNSGAHQNEGKQS